MFRIVTHGDANVKQQPEGPAGPKYHAPEGDNPTPTASTTTDAPINRMMGSLKE